MRGLVPEYNVPEIQAPYRSQWSRMHRRHFGRLLHQDIEIVQRSLRLPIGEDDITQLLQGAENEEGIEDHGHHFSCGKPVSEYQVQQDEQDTLAKEIDEGALYEAERADALHFSQLESQYLESVLIKALYFLICQTETLHQLDISQRFRGAAGQRIGLGRNGALDTLDLPAEDAGQHGQQDHAQYIYRHDRPVQRERINGYEDDADDDRKKHIDKGN